MGFMTQPVTNKETPDRTGSRKSSVRSSVTGRFVGGAGAVTRRSSDLSKKSAEVFAQAEQGPVTVTRRDGESMVLMAAHRVVEMDVLLDSAASFTQALLRAQPEPVTAMAEVYPWMMALSQTDRAACASELRDAALASFSTGQARLLEEAVASWRGTAEAIAAGLTDGPAQLLHDQPLVERP